MRVITSMRPRLAVSTHAWWNSAPSTTRRFGSPMVNSGEHWVMRSGENMRHAKRSS
jgi:hypothetical protein